MSAGRSRTLALAALCALSSLGSVRAATIGEAEIARMRTPSERAAPMFAACSSNVSVDALAALAARGIRATVFVSGQAMEGPSALADLLASRPELFEVGNLGAACRSKSQIASGVARDLAAGREEPEAQRKAMRELAGEIVEGSKAIEARLGRKPKFYAFGADFADPALDPYEQNRLLAGVGDYLDAPSAAARYEALAASKAAFAAWTPMLRLDRASNSALSGQNRLSQDSIAKKLAALPAGFATRTASQAWEPAMRGPDAKSFRAQAERPR